MKNLFLGWLSNAVISALAAIMAIMQEVWIDTEYSFLAFLALGTSVGIALSLCTEMAKSVFWECKWNWRSVAIGALCGIFASIIMSLIV